MNKRINKFAVVAALSLVLLCCIFAAKNPTETSVSDVPTNTVPVLSATDVDLSTAEPHEVYTVTVVYVDSDDNPIAPSVTKELKAGEAYSVSTASEHVNSGKTEEPHETIDSLIKKGVLTPYQIPGFPIAGPFWEKYGMALDSKSVPVA